MTFTASARALLQRLEGCRLRSYQDEAGVWTIGYGHTGPDVREGLVWTLAQCDAALDADLHRFIEGVRQRVGSAALTDNQFSALVIFSFNVGLLAFMSSTALHDIQFGRLDRVPADLALWNKVKDKSGVHVVSANLVKRRGAEGDLWRTP